MNFYDKMITNEKSIVFPPRLHNLHTHCFTRTNIHESRNRICSFTWNLFHCIDRNYEHDCEHVSDVSCLLGNKRNCVQNARQWPRIVWNKWELSMLICWNPLACMFVSHTHTKSHKYFLPFRRIWLKKILWRTKICQHIKTRAEKLKLQDLSCTYIIY